MASSSQDTAPVTAETSKDKDAVITEPSEGSKPAEASHSDVKHSEAEKSNEKAKEEGSKEEEDEEEYSDSSSDDDFPKFEHGKFRGKVTQPVTGGGGGRPARPTRPVK